MRLETGPLWYRLARGEQTAGDLRCALEELERIRTAVLGTSGYPPLLVHRDTLLDIINAEGTYAL